MGKNVLFKGFRFGSLLQLAVGPICIFIFNKAINQGFITALFGVIGVSIMDGVFITLSIIGVTTIVKKKEKAIKIIGSLILVLFGCTTIYSALFSGNGTTQIVEQGSTYLNTFLKAIVLTGANPLTIVFWSGVFSSKIIEDNYNKNDEILFGVGAVLSTFIWLTIVSVIGQLTTVFLSEKITTMLNVIVGGSLIYFGVRLFLVKSSDPCKTNI